MSMRIDANQPRVEQTNTTQPSQRSCHRKTWGILSSLAVVAMGAIAALYAQHSAPTSASLEGLCPLTPVPFKQLCPQTPLFNFTQGQINSFKWQQPLAVDPPRPGRRLINCDKAQEWVDAHQGFRAKVVARELIKNIQYFQQEHFEEALRCSVASFNHYMEANGNPDYIAFGTKCSKSEFWVASLALRHLTTIPTDVSLGRKGLPASILKHPHIRNVVIFDDGIYSAGQISETILKNILPVMQEQFPDGNFEIHLVVPYITKGASVLNKELYGHKGTVPQLVVHGHQLLPPITELIPEEMQDDFFTVYGHKNWASLLIFDHKIPDHVSNYERQIHDGAVGNSLRTRWEKISDWYQGIPEHSWQVTIYKPFVQKKDVSAGCWGSFRSEYCAAAFQPPYREVDYLPGGCNPRRDWLPQA